jgi:hypothetical protein
VAGIEPVSKANTQRHETILLTDGNAIVIERADRSGVDRYPGMVQTRTTLFHPIMVEDFFLSWAGGKVVLRALGMGEAAGSIPAQSILFPGILIIFGHYIL